MRPYAFVFSSGACSAAGVRHGDRKVHSAPQRPPRHPSQFIFPASFDLVAAAVVVLIVSAACRFHSRAKWERSKALFAGQDKDAKQYHLPRLRTRYINIRQPTGESVYTIIRAALIEQTPLTRNERENRRDEEKQNPR